jgi:hypothetical protein
MSENLDKLIQILQENDLKSTAIALKKELQSNSLLIKMSIMEIVRLSLTKYTTS